MTSAPIPVPTDVDEITTEWLASALDAWNVIDGSRIASVTIDAIGMDQGFVGRLYRCHLSYDSSPLDSPRSLVIKFPGADKALRELFNEFGLYEREVRFYAEIGAATGLPTARCYYAATDDSTGNFVILLEDLAPASPGDTLAGATEKEAERALDLISHMHAKWWNHQALSELDWLPSPSTDRMRDLINRDYAEAWARFAANFGEYLPAAVMRLGAQLGEHLVDVIERLSAPPTTLVHGDFQPGNVFYDEDDAIRALIDWQVVVSSRGPMDVAYFVARSLDPAVRRRVERKLVRRYHASLLNAGVRDYSFDECWDDYRLAILSQFGLGVVLAHALQTRTTQPKSSERLRAVAAVVGSRLTAALVDLRPLEVITGRPLWKRIPILSRLG